MKKLLQFFWMCYMFCAVRWSSQSIPFTASVLTILRCAQPCLICMCFRGGVRKELLSYQRPNNNFGWDPSARCNSKITVGIRESFNWNEYFFWQDITVQDRILHTTGLTRRKDFRHAEIPTTVIVR